MAEASVMGRPAPAVRDRVGTPMPILPGPFGAMRGFIQSIAADQWFTPGQPVSPQAPPATEPRALDYPVGINIMYVPRSEEDITFAQLRSLGDLWDLCRLAIETKKSQLCSIDWSIRPVKKPNEKTADYKKRAAEDPKVEKLRKVFQRPNGIDTFSTWLRTVLEELFVLDALCLVPGDREGQTTFEVIDGATIKRLIDNKGRTPTAEDGAAYQQVIKGVPAIDFTTKELFYRRRNIRAHKLYGMSPVEQIVWTINFAIRRQLYKLAWYTEGNIPEAFIRLPADWGIDQVKTFSEWFNSLLSGQVDVRRKAFFLPGVAGEQSVIFPKQDTLKDEMDEWLAKLVCYAFDLSSQAFISHMNRATADTAQEASRAEGLAPWIKFLSETFTDLIALHLNEPDYEFAFADDVEFDSLKRAQRQVLEVRNGIRSPDEVREENGDDPIGVGPGIVTMNGFVELTTAVDQSETELDNAKNPPDPQPQPGNQGPGADAGGAAGSGKGGAQPSTGGVQKVSAPDAWKSDRGKRRLVRTEALLQRFFEDQRKKVAQALGQAYDTERNRMMAFMDDVRV